MKRASQVVSLLALFALAAGAFHLRAQVVVTSPIVDASFIRGDTNGDQEVDFDDALASLNYLFKRGPTPACLDAADANDDGRINLTDPIVTMLFLFAGGTPLPAPVGSPGSDPTPDDLACH